MRECMNCMCCMRCMEPDGSGKADACPKMSSLPGYEERFPEVLPPETILYDRYVVGRALSLTDYSVIYLCWDALLERRVVIREFFPISCVCRAEDRKTVSVKPQAKGETFQKGKKAFIEEAALLHLHQDIREIIHIYRIFEENQTAYYLMEYIEGTTLQDYFADYRRMDPVTARELFLNLARIVEKLHAQDICHLNLAPENIFLDADRQMKLTDFGRAKLDLMRVDKKNCPVLLEEAFAAPELLERENPTKQADLYSMGAIYLQMLSGSPPGDNPKKILRSLKKEGTDPTGVRITEMLLVDHRERRPDSVEQLLKYTGGDPKRRS